MSFLPIKSSLLFERLEGVIPSLLKLEPFVVAAVVSEPDDCTLKLLLLLYIYYCYYYGFEFVSIGLVPPPEVRFFN